MKKTTSAHGRTGISKVSKKKRDHKYDELMREYDEMFREVFEAATPFLIKNVLGIDVAHMEDIPDPVSERKKARRAKKDYRK
ncbi:MAG TPA: hypothetical protein VI233_17700 [Puia sp.]